MRGHQQKLGCPRLEIPPPTAHPAGEKSHVAIERRGTLYSEKEDKQWSTPNNSPRKSLESGQSIKYLGNKDTFLAVQQKKRVRLRRVRCLSKTAYVLCPSIHPKTTPKPNNPVYEDT